MFDLRKIFDLRKFFAVPKNFFKSKIHCTIYRLCTRQYVTGCVITSAPYLPEN